MKLQTLFLFIIISISIFAQNNDVTKEIEGKIDDAKIRVDKEINNPALNNKAQTWYLYSYVYKEIAKSEVFAHLDATPEEKSVNAIEKCKELDTDNKYYSDIISLMLELGPIIYNKAINNYNLAVKNNSSVEQFKVASYYFNLFYQVIDILGKDDKKFIDQFIEYNGINPRKTYIFSGFAADKIGETEKAHKYYNTVIDLTASDEHEKQQSFALIYYYEAELLIREQKDDKAQLILDKALKVWPDNKDIVVLSINFYKKKKDNDRLGEVMETAVINNPNDVSLLYTLARNYYNMAKSYYKNGYQGTADKYTDDAINTYKKAIAIGTTKKKLEVGLNFNLGVIYFNKAARIYNNKTGGIEEYENTLKSAMPYLEKAYELDSTNSNAKKMLLKIYQTLELNEKLKTLQN